jgi:NitT/TauT family transport system substrate-binding protein
VTKVAPERFDWAFTARDQYRDPDGMPNLEALQANLDQTRVAGLLKDTIDVKMFTDVSMAREAAARLK